MNCYIILKDFFEKAIQEYYQSSSLNQTRKKVQFDKIKPLRQPQAMIRVY